MTNENSSDTPVVNPEHQPPRQPPVTPYTPFRGTLSDDGKREADDTKNEADELAREFRAAEKWVIGTNITLAIVGIIALCIYNGQLKEMRKATRATQIAAEAAKKSADTANATLKDYQKSFVINERPYMVTDGGAPQFATAPAINVPVQANVTIKNIGKTPALKMLWNVSLVKHRGGPKTPKGYAEFKSFINSAFDDLHNRDEIGRKEISDNGVEQDLAPGATMFTTSQNIVNLSAPELADLGTSKVALFYIGVISYTDSSGTIYVTQFCEFYFGVDPRVWHVCDSHNKIK